MYPNLKLQLWRAGIRQKLLAEMLGLDETLLSKVLNGHREANAELRTRIATVLGRDEKWLFRALRKERAR
jgi:transcriptional regulator with XRE-family HTH domain